MSMQFGELGSGVCVCGEGGGGELWTCSIIDR